MSAQNKQTFNGEYLEYLPKKEKKQFLKLLSIQSNGDNEKRMFLYIANWLQERNISFEIDEIGNIIATKGEGIKPCICSHIDTVHAIKSNFLVTVKNKNGRQIAMSFSDSKQVGIGGDDKCGIYSCFYMLERFDNIKAIFFTQEETGLIGSSNISFDHFQDVSCLIQLDRWGRSDFICKTFYNSTVSDSFLLTAKESMVQYGYKPAEGLITDSINLFEQGIGVSCINVSCGYYEHHTAKEVIDLNEFWNSLKFTHSLISSLQPEYYACYYTEEVGEWSRYNEYLDYSTDLYDEIISDLIMLYGVNDLTQLDDNLLNNCWIDFNGTLVSSKEDCIAYDDFITLLYQRKPLTIYDDEIV